MAKKKFTGNPKPKAKAGSSKISIPKPAPAPAAAAAPKPQRAKVTAAAVLFECPVKFGRVGLGTRTGSVGFSVAREYCSLARADELFVDRRLNAKVILGRSGDANGQKAFIESDVVINGTFDVKGFRVGATSLSGLALVFMLKEIELDDISKLSGGSGRIQITAAAEIPADAIDDAPDPNQRKLPEPATGPWADVALKDAMPALTAAMLKNLAAVDLHTMGDLQNYVAKKGQFWAKDIVGIGPGAQAKIEDWNIEFWAANPQYSKP